MGKSSFIVLSFPSSIVGITLIYVYLFLAHFLLFCYIYTTKPIRKAMIEEEEKFVIRAYLKAELAQLYCPNLPAMYAMRKLRSWIRKHKILNDTLYQGGESKKDHSYTKRQVRLIVQYLDEP